MLGGIIFERCHSIPVVFIFPSTPGVIYEDEDDEDDLDQDNLSNFLTKEERQAMTPQQKAHWKAMQSDLATRRKG